ncbi:hypothetical protein B0T26DRAFT_750713 [Lasiosphaeria miniovina]|uniref:Glycine zipper 2TM domain-containing protein n=1 Tax=Lasiosphaeria miniovina TaxID=1954250 RepID=A0AA40E484_9PEZI|nr:uncharacterized protein B0T26DRAFT_750713 [Lasiosphaeria miniovina]KAK0723441.1 hypothetical protein B0T26DRAFT_750713 [Lasiosphaeria miniovina]
MTYPQQQYPPPPYQQQGQPYPPQTQPDYSQQHLQPYMNPQDQNSRPTSAQSGNAAYSAPSPYDRPPSSQSGAGYRPQPTYADPQQQQYKDSSTSTYPGATQQGSAVPAGTLGPDGPDGEKGFLSTVAGGAGGAFLGSKIGHGGTMSKIMGGAAGAIAANFIESKLKDKKHNKHSNQNGGASQGGIGGMLGGLMGGSSQQQQPQHTPNTAKELGTATDAVTVTDMGTAAVGMDTIDTSSKLFWKC